MDDGYIKLYRKSMDSQVFQNEGLWKVWCYCLMKATYKKRWVSVKIGRATTEVELQPGQFIFGRKSAAKKLGMKPSTLRNRIKKLKKMQNVDTQEDTHYTIITIINWDTYADTKKKEDTQEDNRRTPVGHKQERIRKNNNKEKVNQKEKPEKENELRPKKKSIEECLVDEYLDYSRELSAEYDMIEYNSLIELFIRQRMEKPKSKRYQSALGIKTLFRNLAGCRDKGYDIAECIEIASGNGWQVPNPSYFDNQYLKSRPKPLNGTDNIPAPKTYAQLQHQERQMQIEFKKQLEKELYPNGRKRNGFDTIN